MAGDEIDRLGALEQGVPDDAGQVPHELVDRPERVRLDGLAHLDEGLEPVASREHRDQGHSRVEGQARQSAGQACPLPDELCLHRSGAVERDEAELTSCQQLA